MVRETSGNPIVNDEDAIHMLDKLMQNDCKAVQIEMEQSFEESDSSRESKQTKEDNKERFIPPKYDQRQDYRRAIYEQQKQLD